MSYYNHAQNGVQHPQNQQLVRQTGSTGSSGVIPPQMFGQLQFAQSGSTNSISFPDPNSANHIQILHQQPQQPAFQNLNFLTEQLTAGVGQIISQAAQSQSQTISMQNLMNPMTMTNLTSVGFAPSLQVTQTASTQQQSSGQQQKQRVFTGTVTKTHDNFGFIDEEVFFQMGAVKGPILPKAGDRVLVEADFNSAMPFKWNATRVQIVNLGGGITNMSSSLNPGGKSQSPQPNPQHLQHMHQNFQLQNQAMEKRPQGLVAPPPPILSNVNTSRQASQSNSGVSNTGSHYSQVSIISNPHSIYSHQGNPNSGTMTVSGAETNRGGQAPTFQQPPRTPNRGRVSAGGQQMSAQDSGMPSQAQYQGNPGIPSLFQSPDVEIIRDGGMELGSKKQKERGRDRERDEDRERERERERDREREKDREREREKNKTRDRERERERERDREREKEREREREKDREREREKDREREREKDRERDRDKEKNRDKDREKLALGRERDREKRRRSPTREDLRRDLAREKDRDRDRNRSPSPAHSRKSSRSRDKGKEKEKVVTESNETEKSSSKRKSKSPSPKRKIRSTTRYCIDLPKHSLDTVDMNVMELKKRYPDLYVPSDLFLAKSVWTESFPAFKPLELTKSTRFHVFRRHVDKIDLGTFEREQENETDNSALKLTKLVENVEPSDASQVFSAKVILMTLPGASLYRKTCTLSEGGNTDDVHQHLNRLINFVVGVKSGRTETNMLIGGPWSPQLDGPDPHSNPQVLVNTAIRTCKALTGIDLQRCTQWYRFMELYYRRSNGNLETVVVFLPDISTCLPSNNEWLDIVQTYKVALHGQDKVSSTTAVEKEPEQDIGSTADLDPVSPEESTPMELDVLKVTSSAIVPDIATTQKQDKLEEVVQMEAANNTDVGIGNSVNIGPTEETVVKMEIDNEIEKESEEHDTSVSSALAKEVTADAESPTKNSDSTPTKNRGNVGTHFTLLEPKNMNVAKLREELGHRGLSTKGLKPQLLTRLVKVLKDEEESESASGSVEAVVTLPPVESIGEDKSLPTPVMPTPTKDSLVDDQSESQLSQELRPVQIEEVQSQNVDVPRTDTIPIETISTPTMNVELTAEAGKNVPEIISVTDDLPAPTVDSIVLSSSKVLEKKKVEDKEIYKPQVSPGVLVPIMTENMDEKTRKIWERRFALPKKAHLLVHPSKTAKAGDFDCVQTTLASLKDYRSSDIKEPAFEVSLFAEFFHEMLQRDFAFRIYYELLARGLRIENETPAESETEKCKKGEDKSVCDSPDIKKRKLSSASSTGTLQRPADVKMRTMDPNLLLSFTFFDSARYGYFTENDLEELCLALGFGMCRSQLRKAIRKVISKGKLEYRTLTDKPQPDVERQQDTQSDEHGPNNLNLENLKIIAQGNKALFPIFAYSQSVVDSDMEGGDLSASCNSVDELKSVSVMLDGQEVDVKKLKEQIDKYDGERRAVKATLNVMTNSLNEAKNQVTDLRKTNETLKEELLRTKDSLKKQEALGKANTDDLEVFRKASERYFERVHDLVKLTPKDKDKEIKLPIKGESTASKEETVEAVSETSSK